MTIRGAGIYGGNMDWAGTPAEAQAAPRPHSCTRVAIVGGIRYPCRSHEGDVHHFAAHWPACPAPFCRLEPGHRGLHDIPFGKAEYADAQD
jgi:hypothetical protein